MSGIRYRTDEQIGAYIKELRKQFGMSQADLGEALGLPQPAVSKIENGARVVSSRELVFLSEQFGVTTADLLREEDAVPAFLRVGEGDAPGVDESLRLFRSCIDEYHGVLALVSDATDAA